jgi:hypothetical protein
LPGGTNGNSLKTLVMIFNVPVEAGTRNLQNTRQEAYRFSQFPRFPAFISVYAVGFLRLFQSPIRLLSVAVEVTGKRIIEETMEVSLHIFLQEHSILSSLCKKI